MINAALFPAIAVVSPVSRELSTFCGAAFSILVAVAAFTRPSLIRERVISVALFALLALGLVLLCAGVADGNEWAILAGSPFGGIGMVWFSVLLGVALTRLSAREAAVAIPLAFVLSYFVRFALALTSLTVPLPLAALVYLASLVGIYGLVEPSIAGILQTIRVQESPTVLDATNPSSYLPFSSFVYLTVFLFNAACGFEMAQTGGKLPFASEIASFVPAGLVLVAAFFPERSPSADGLHRFSALLVFGGLLLVPLGLGPSGSAAAAQGGAVLLRGGADTFAVLTYLLVAAIGARNPLGALSTSAFAFAASWIGIGVGALGSMGLESLSVESPDAVILATTAVTFLFVAYNFVVLRPHSFNAAIADVVPAHPAPTPSHLVPDAPALQSNADDESRLDAACAVVADRFGLTGRERDVLALLARGRTSPIIQKKLTVSHNTVKSHVRHIYTKLDVHSQQELIDLVEREAIGGPRPL